MSARSPKVQLRDGLGAAYAYFRRSSRRTAPSDVMDNQGRRLTGTAKIIGNVKNRGRD